MSIYSVPTGDKLHFFLHDLVYPAALHSLSVSANYKKSLLDGCFISGPFDAEVITVIVIYSGTPPYAHPIITTTFSWY